MMSKDQPVPKEPNDRGTDLQPHTAVPTWDSMSPGEKQAWLLDKALDYKRELFVMPLPDPNDDSIEAHRTRSLIPPPPIRRSSKQSACNQLKPAAAYDDIEKIFEERQKRALLEIERLTDGKPSKPN
jgi:hypothetical protein